MQYNQSNQNNQKPEPIPQGNQDAWIRTGGEFASGPPQPKVPVSTGTSGGSKSEQKKN